MQLNVCSYLVKREVVVVAVSSMSNVQTLVGLLLRSLRYRPRDRTFKHSPFPYLRGGVRRSASETHENFFVGGSFRACYEKHT